MGELFLRVGDTVKLRVKLIREGEGDVTDSDLAGSTVKLELVDEQGGILASATGSYDSIAKEWVFVLNVPEAALSATKAYVVVENAGEGLRESSRPLNVHVER